jgi:asparagine synthetase B (glutamine-hydrolysing)
MVLLSDVLKGFVARRLKAPALAKSPELMAWLDPGFVERNRDAFSRYPVRIKLFGPLPRYQHHIHALNHWIRVLANVAGSRAYLDMQREYRYPYLDRDLLEFAYAIPQEQIVGVGKRRFLMKRALRGIVPDELLNRKRRASVLEKQGQGKSIDGCTEALQLLGSIGIVNKSRLADGFTKHHLNSGISSDALRRLQILASWIRHLEAQGILRHSLQTGAESSIECQRRQSTAQSNSSAC